ncbi:MAG: zinc-ribbon domain-containing protein [Gammaproteobacteria bacterium]|nr:zinc-ribbon domain-containing protein [Gammaproteobacteria bacterium]
MSLIRCSECNSDVSDKASTCPKCGAPISNDNESVGSGVHLKTVQETSKKFKLQTLLSVSFIIVGGVWSFVSVSAVTEGIAEPSPAGAYILLIGIIWYLINRFRIWWHHK